MTKPAEKVYKLEFIMPCFCAGADNVSAEIRPPSIRGALRWWFRALGGIRAEEKDVFGGIGAAECTGADAGGPVSSAVVVRTVKEKRNPFQFPRFSPTDSCSYVWHFVKATGGGARWEKPNAALGPGSKFELRVAFRHAVGAAAKAKFDEALRCFLALGGLGLRKTRGLGTFHCEEVKYDGKIAKLLKDRGFAVEEIDAASDCERIASLIGSLVKGTRKREGFTIDLKNGKEVLSSFGSSRTRQSSAVHFRPVKTVNGLKLVIFEAPHDKVLGYATRCHNDDVIVGNVPTRIVK